MNRLGWLLLIAAVLGWAEAHPMPSSVVLLDVYENAVEAEVQIPLSELSLALKEDLMGDPDAVLAAHGAELRSYLTQHIRPSTPDGQSWSVRVDDLIVKGAEQTATGPYQELVAHLTFTPPAGADTRVFTLDYDAVVHQVVTHRALVSIRQDWAGGVIAEHPAEVGVVRVNPVDGTVDPLEVDRTSGTL